MRLYLIPLLFSFLINGYCQQKLNQHFVDSMISHFELDLYGSVTVGSLNSTDSVVIYSGHKKAMPTDLYNVASISKTFTGLGILKLIQENQLKPSDPIGNYINGLQPELTNVTVEQLVFHTNGIHDYFSLTDKHFGITNKGVLKMISELDTTVFKPGTNWGYTNSGYVLLAAIIENITQQKYLDWIEKNFFKPYSMNLATHPLKTSKKPLYGHTTSGKKDSVTTLTYGGGNFTFSAKDFMAFGKALQTNKELKSLIDLAKTRKTDWIRDPNWKLGYGFWFSSDKNGEFIAFSGRSASSLTYYRYYLSKKVFLFYSTNQDATQVKEFRNALIELSF